MLGLSQNRRQVTFINFSLSILASEPSQKQDASRKLSRNYSCLILRTFLLRKQLSVCAYLLASCRGSTVDTHSERQAIGFELRLLKVFTIATDLIVSSA